MTVWWPGPWGKGIMGSGIGNTEMREAAARMTEEVVMPESPHQAAIDTPKRTRRTKSDG